MSEVQPTESWPRTVLCQDCKHARCPHGSYECRHPLSDAWVASYVDGKIDQVNSGVWINSGVWEAFCENNRSYGPCNKNAKYFERKDPEVTKWTAFITAVKKWWNNDSRTGSRGP